MSETTYIINILDGQDGTHRYEIELSGSVSFGGYATRTIINMTDNRVNVDFNQPVALAQLDDNIHQFITDYENRTDLIAIYGE